MMCKMKGTFGCFLILLMTFSQVVCGQKMTQMEIIPGKMITDYAPSHFVGEERQIPEGYQKKVEAEWKSNARLMPHSKTQSTAKSQILITFETVPSADVKAVFERAAEAWSNVISSDIPIRLYVQWASLGKNVLGKAGASAHARNFPGATRLNTFYPIALAEKMAHRNLNGDGPDIIASFSKDYPAWYIGTGLPKVPSTFNASDGQIDLYSVVLHEIGHGLGFIGQINAEDAGTEAEYGVAGIFDQFMVNAKGSNLTDTTLFKNPSAALKTELTTSENLFLSSPTLSKNIPKKVNLYSPSTFSSGSSLYHLDQSTYGVGDQNALMIPFIAQGEITHQIGPIVQAAFADFGWKSTSIVTENYNDTEDIDKDFVFEAKLFSDTLINESSFKLMIAVNSSISSAVPYTPKKGLGNSYTVTLPSTKTSKTVSYYWTVNDVTGRKYTSPAEAPIISGTQWGSFFQVNIVEKDTVKPQVVFGNPIKYMFSSQLDLPLPSLYAVDNIGIDTVYLEYSINNGAVVRQGSLKSTKEEFAYNQGFKFLQGQLKAGDIVRYRLVVKDKAKLANVVNSPSSGFYEFVVLNLQTAVKDYATTFDNTPAADFYLKGFNFSQPAGFTSISLNSAHPYADGNEDFENGSAGSDKFTNNDAVLLKPIIVRSDTSKIYFNEIALVEPGDTGENFLNEDGSINRNFFDYVIVQGSKDLGKTWVNLTDGWDATKESVWLSAWNKSIDRQGNSTTKATSDLYKATEIDIRSSGYFKAGDQVLLRFRLHADVGAYGWGWSIDNLNIQGPKKSLTNLVLGTEDDPNSLRFELFPNPNEGTFKLSFYAKNPGSNDLSVQIRDLLGRDILTEKFNMAGPFLEKTYALTHLGTGMYFIEVDWNGQRSVRRMLITK